MDLHAKQEFLSNTSTLPEAFNTQYGLDTALMSDSLRDSDGETTHTKQVLGALGVSAENVRELDAQLFRDASQLIGLRAARLSACALAAVIESEASENAAGDINIGLDGSWVDDVLIGCSNTTKTVSSSSSRDSNNLSGMLSTSFSATRLKNVSKLDWLRMEVEWEVSRRAVYVLWLTQTLTKLLYAPCKLLSRELRRNRREGIDFCIVRASDMHRC